MTVIEADSCLICLLGFNLALTSEDMSQCLLVALVLWPMCCHTGMPCQSHRTWHPTPSQYTDTGPTCRCATHWCGTSHWNTKLPILMSCVRPNREILPQPSTHTSEHSTLCYGGSQLEAPQKVYRTHRVFNMGPVVCKSTTLPARPQLLPPLIEVKHIDYCCSHSYQSLPS